MVAKVFCFFNLIWMLCFVYVLFFCNADVASDWLSCFPVSVQKHLYDLFFLDGPVVEVVQVLVPFLHHVDKNAAVDANSVQTNVERCPKHTQFSSVFFIHSFSSSAFPYSSWLRTRTLESLLHPQFFFYLELSGIILVFSRFNVG